jgi:hypothetical protein
VSIHWQVSRRLAAWIRQSFSLLLLLVSVNTLDDSMMEAYIYSSFETGFILVDLKSVSGDCDGVDDVYWIALQLYIKGVSARSLF